MKSESNLEFEIHDTELLQNLNVSIAVVISDYYDEIAERLLSGATKILNSHPKVSYETVRVSGAWELPVVTKSLMQSNRFHGIITIGCVIRGETDHYDHICQQCMNGLMKVSLEYTTPVGLALLTVSDEKQARFRSHPTKLAINKGADAALALLRSVYAIAEIRQES